MKSLLDWLWTISSLNSGALKHKGGRKTFKMNRRKELKKNGICRAKR